MYSLIAETSVQYVMMYCKNPSGRADKEHIDYPQGIVAHVMDFFRTQIAAVQQAGVRRDQIILDP
jgi:dihydropteroate synthase